MKLLPLLFLLAAPAFAQAVPVPSTATLRLRVFQTFQNDKGEWITTNEWMKPGVDAIVFSPDFYADVFITVVRRDLATTITTPAPTPQPTPSPTPTPTVTPVPTPNAPPTLITLEAEAPTSSSATVTPIIFKFRDGVTRTVTLDYEGDNRLTQWLDYQTPDLAFADYRIRVYAAPEGFGYWLAITAGGEFQQLQIPNSFFHTLVSVVTERKMVGIQTIRVTIPRDVRLDRIEIEKID